MGSSLRALSNPQMSTPLLFVFAFYFCWTKQKEESVCKEENMLSIFVHYKRMNRNKISRLIPTNMTYLLGN